VSFRNIFAAGSIMWLLKHECRIFFYSFSVATSSGKATRGFPRVGKGWLITIILMLHLFAWVTLDGLPQFGNKPPAQLLMGVGGGLVMLFLMMLSYALKSCVSTLYQRGDLDLLLSSPLDTRTIFSAKLIGVALGVSSLALAILAPFANVGLILGLFHWIAIYPVVLSLGFLSTSLAMLSSLCLVRIIGVRYAAQLGQLLSAFIGAVVFLLYETSRHLPTETLAKVINHIRPYISPGSIFDPKGWVYWPAWALFGKTEVILVTVLVSGTLFLLTLHFSHRYFVSSKQRIAGSVVRKTHSIAVNHKFSRIKWMNPILKEWRLLHRDARLLGQISLELFYLIPMAFIVVFNGRNAAPGTVSMLTFFTGALASSLAWITIAAEEAPALLQTSPVSWSSVRNSKILAALIPALVPAVITSILLSIHSATNAVYVIFCSTGAGISGCLASLYLRSPAKKSQFNARMSANIPASLIEIVSSLLWGIIAFLLAESSGWLVIPCFLEMCVLLIVIYGKGQYKNYHRF